MRRQSSPSLHVLLSGLVGFVLLFAALWPVATRSRAQTGSDALLRFLNASPDGLVDVYIEDVRVADTLGFTAATDYGTIPEGTYTIRVVTAGADPDDQPLLEGSAQLMPGASHSLVLFDRAESLKAQLLTDDLTAPESGASLRFFQAAGEASVVDVVTSSGQTLFEAVPFGQEAGAIPLAAGEYVLEVRPVGNPTPVLTETLQLGEGSIQTALLAGFVSQDPGIQLWVVEYPARDDELLTFPPLIPQITGGGQTPGPEETPTAGEPAGTPGGAPAQATPEPTATPTPGAPYPPPATATATATPEPTATPTPGAPYPPPDTATPTEEPAEPTPTATTEPAATATATPTEVPGQPTATNTPTATATPQPGMPPTGGEDGGLGSLVLMILGLALLDAGIFLVWRRQSWRLRRPF